MVKPRLPLHPSGERFEQSEHRSQQRGLATSVRTNNPHDLPPCDFERQIVEESLAAISESDALALQHPLTCHGSVLTTRS